MVRLSKAVDKAVGSVLVGSWGSFASKRKMPSPVKRILLIRLWALGDSVITLVLIKALKVKFPSAKIYVLARSRNKIIYENNKNIEKILSIKEIVSEPKFDLVFDTEPYLNISALMARKKGKFVVGFSHALRARLYDAAVVFSKKQHMVENYLDMIRVLGFTFDADRLERVGLKKEDEKKVELFLKEKKIKKIAGLCIGAAETATSQRMWPLERFALVADYLAMKGFAVVFVASPTEKSFVRETIGKMKQGKKAFATYDYFTLGESMALISKCSLFVSNDTGPMHIAAAQGVPTIGLFGANTPVVWAPYGKGNISLYHKHRDGPCMDNMTGKIRKCDGCAESMRKITVEEVEKAIDTILKKKR